MINNIDQYSTTKHWLINFETSVRLLNIYGDAEDPLFSEKVHSLNSQIEIFKKELTNYERTKAIV